MILRSAEIASYLAGGLFSAVFVAYLAWGEVEREQGIERFAVLAGATPAAQAATTFAEPPPPDTSLWAPQRVADYRASLSASLPPVLGVLEIPAVGLQVPVYPSDSELVLDRGAGVIDGMAYPHEGGNIGIAGHRDGYFRALKDVHVGDVIALQTLVGKKRFRVEATRIVQATDTALLRDTVTQTLTLVTCYPFYYVGHAPRRFIVIATPDTPPSGPD